MITHNTDDLKPGNELMHGRFSATITAHCKCHSCSRDFLIEASEPLSGSPLMIALGLRDAIEGQMEEDGWLDGACPNCAFDRMLSLSAAHHADGAREMEEFA